MQFAADPAVGSFVCIKRQNEPLWLQVASVNPGQGTLTATVLASTVAVGADIGAVFTVPFTEILDTKPATATVVAPTATISVKSAEKLRLGKF